METQLDIFPIIIGVGYTLFVLLFCGDRYMLLRSLRNFQLHIIFAILLTGVGIYQIIISDRFFYGNLFYFTPLLYILLLLGSNIIIKSNVKRDIIPANKYNMISASASGAIWIDYVAFIIIHFLPIIIPASLLKT